MLDPHIHRDYVEKLIKEISFKAETFAADYFLDTIYIGGGTPSIILPSLIEEITDAIYVCFNVADDCEITIEVNPATVDSYALREYRTAGVNRLSIGAQSFNEKHLKYLGRIHDASDIFTCYEDAVSSGFSNINVDLIFGLPEQTLSEWEEDVRTLLGVGPAHISFYSLQIEEGTQVFSDIMSGRATEADEFDDRRMYHIAKELLSGSGYVHYEISNSAKPGFESKHNLKYWSLQDYIGVGLAAHSYVCGHRFSNTSELTDYLSSAKSIDMIDFIHKNTRGENMSEYVFLGLRKTEGINLSHFKKEFGRDFWETYGEETESLIGRGLLEVEEAHGQLRLTELGLDLANSVFVEYV
jgi:oxygen-independent coproporphyrinogen-3 oxidase